MCVGILWYESWSHDRHCVTPQNVCKFHQLWLLPSFACTGLEETLFFFTLKTIKGTCIKTSACALSSIHPAENNHLLERDTSHPCGVALKGARITPFESDSRLPGSRLEKVLDWDLRQTFLSFSTVLSLPHTLPLLLFSCNLSTSILICLTKANLVYWRENYWF